MLNWVLKWVRRKEPRIQFVKVFPSTERPLVPLSVHRTLEKMIPVSWCSKKAQTMAKLL